MIGGLMDSDVTVVRLDDGPRDRTGKPTRVEVQRTTYRARVEQVGSAEGEVFVLNRWTAYLPGSADVHAGDRVEFRGLVLEVDGAATLRRIPGFPSITHVVANLVYREG
jgi:hypothetical protein